MRTSHAGWLAALTTALSPLITVPAAAQTVTSLQEVIVTARKRPELFRNLPMTESVFTPQTIKSANITSPRDFIAMVPNMTLVQTQNVGNAFVTIRGISQARNSEPSVAVIVDGVEETDPEEFAQELYGIQQIEVLKGPQGALYGRDAIGGAIIITTTPPSDHPQGEVTLGVGNGTAEHARGNLSGPLDSSGTLKYDAALNFYNTDGYLENTYLHRKADPYRDYSGRLRYLWNPNDAFSADLRLFYDRVQTTAYYYVIPRNNEANPFASFTTPPDANDITSPIQVNNEGTDNRDIIDIPLKLDYRQGFGTFTSITDYDQTKEIDTGDAYDFRPIPNSIDYNFLYQFTGTAPGFGGPFDESQSQFIRVRTWSEDLRFTSPSKEQFTWIAGVYFLHKERFISTDNIVDRGLGVPAVYETPLVDPSNPWATNTNVTFLADGQKSNAWAGYGDATYKLSKQWEIDAALRYDQDKVSDTTRTPPAFLKLVLDPTAFTGEVRTETWGAWQPKLTLRYQPSDDWTLYTDWSRGFRSGGFNQTGVGAVAAAAGIKGVNDTFNAEIADTYELGVKGDMLDHRLSLDADVFHTHSDNGYFFDYLSQNSTQNLGNLNATYKGAEIQLTAYPSEHLQIYAGYGYTDSRITKMADPSVLGNQAPLVSRDTVNAGAMYVHPLADGLTGTARVDFQNIGRTWWDPYDLTSRDPISLVNLDLSLQGGRWTVTAWSKNLTNKIYNAEFSPGGFLWRALPRRYGVDFEYRF
ncbi:MAG TPA: TonB-dependent receptor [Steroidobacteraceae bacterium]|nr:TonB-dependent receptor [Steroidobacteraceae bacterium]